MNTAASGAGHWQDGPTASRPTFRLVQVLRAVAAIMVVVHHTTLLLHDRNHLPVANWISGGAGVDIFFVISGFVMTVSSAPLRHAAHPARIFLARRIERIVPMYWLATTAKILILLAAPRLALNALGTPWHIIASYLFLASRNPEGAPDPVLVVGWTLNFEMMFYALFAAALALRAPLLRVLAPVLIVLALLPLVPQHGVPVALAWYEKSIVLEFLGGVLLALYLPKIRKLSNTLAWLLILAGFWCLLGLVWPNFSAMGRAFGWGIPAAAIVAGTLALEESWGARTPRWMLLLGDASYSIYLVHGFALPLIGVALAHIGASGVAVVPLTMIVATVVSILAGVAAYRFVERPITRWFKGRRTMAIPAAA